MQPSRGARKLLWSVPVGLQLSAIYAVLLAGVLALLGWGLYAQLNGFMLQSTADQLTRAVRSTLQQPHFDRQVYVVGGNDHGGFPSSDRPQQPNTQGVALLLVRALGGPDVAVAVLDSTGGVITSTQSFYGGDAPYIAPLPATWQSDLTAQPQLKWVANDPTGQRRLVLLTPFLTPGNGGRPPLQLYVEQVASLEAADAVLNQVRLYIILGIVVGTVIGVVAGLALTRVVLRPLDRMVLTAEAISGGDLDRRLRLPPGHNEVARLGHAFDQMVDRLSSALEAQRRFIADASHELRTPLTSLEGLSEMLMMGADRGDTRTVQRTLRSMHSELGRLTRLVADMLTLSRLDSTDTTAAMKLTAVDSCGLLAGVADQVAQLAESREVRVAVECDRPLFVRGEADRLKQVVLNLVDNALRFTPQGGTVTLAATHVVPGGPVQIRVSDTGPGIAPQDLPHVFDRFYRGDLSRTRATGNSGLGLAIARGIVQAHGGTIEAKSPPGEGATFLISLPAAAPQPAPEREVVGTA